MKQWKRALAFCLALVVCAPACAEEPQSEPATVADAPAIVAEVKEPVMANSPMPVTEEIVEETIEEIVEEPIEEEIIEEEPIEEEPIEEEPIEEPVEEEPQTESEPAVKSLSGIDVKLTLAADSTKESLLAQLTAQQPEVTDTTADQKYAVVWTCDTLELKAGTYTATGTIESGETCTIELTLDNPAAFEADGFTLAVTAEGELKLSKYAGDATAVEIPADASEIPGFELPGWKLTAIGEYAFDNLEKLAEIEFDAEVVPEAGKQIIRDCAALTIVRMIVEDEVPAEQEAVAKLLSDYAAMNVTDITLKKGELNVNAELTIAEAHEVQSAEETTLDLNANVTVNGTLNAKGAVKVAENVVIYACGENADISGIDEAYIVTEHEYGSDNICLHCGAVKQTDEFGVSFVNPIKKTYNAKNTLPVDKFTLVNVPEGAKVSIKSVTCEKTNVGEYKNVTATVTLEGEDAEAYSLDPIVITLVVEKKEVKITPAANQYKYYGDSDPTLKASISGVVSGDTFTGSLSRQSGNAIGEYEIRKGNLEEKNPNYTVNLVPTVFTIKAKPISVIVKEMNKTASTLIGSQVYTGKEITPSISLVSNGESLVQDKDYTVSYARNKDIGTAYCTITGKGNYTGTLECTFSIIKTSGGTGGVVVDDDFFDDDDDDDSSSGSSSSSDDEGDGEMVEDTEDEYTALFINDISYGSVLFNHLDEAIEFTQEDIEVTDPENEGETLKYLHLIFPEPTELYDEEYLADPDAEVIGARDTFEPRLKITMEIVRALRDAGYTAIRLEAEEVVADVPLSVLYAQYQDADAIVDVSTYEFHLWKLREEALGYLNDAIAAGYTAASDAVRFEMLINIKPTEENPSPEPRDVLSLMEGKVKLCIPPTDDADLEQLHYSALVLSCPEEDPLLLDAAILSSKETFFDLDEDTQQLWAILPADCGGNYIIALANDVPPSDEFETEFIEEESEDEAEAETDESEII